MKKLLIGFIFLLFKGCFAFGQITYTIPDSLGASKQYFINSTLEQEQDTIPCLLLVCDTALVEGDGITFTESSLDLTPATNEIHYYHHYIYWIKGYYIRANLILLNLDGNYEPVCLDENKNPLSKNIIVWLTK